MNRPTQLEPLGLEHRHAQVDEDQNRHAEQEPLGGAHTRSSAQMRPSITSANAMMARTTRKSAMSERLIQAS